MKNAFLLNANKKKKLKEWVSIKIFNIRINLKNL